MEEVISLAQAVVVWLKCLLEIIVGTDEVGLVLSVACWERRFVLNGWDEMRRWRMSVFDVSC